MIKKIIIFLIKVYQKSLSPDHGFLKIKFLGCCYYPSCSQYLVQAIDKHGAIKGSYMGLRRLFRCHPLSKGGVDHLP